MDADGPTFRLVRVNRNAVGQFKIYHNWRPKAKQAGSGANWLECLTQRRQGAKLRGVFTTKDTKGTKKENQLFRTLFVFFVPFVVQLNSSSRLRGFA
jgi:hypothetical protein